MIEGCVYGKDGWVGVSVDKVGCRVVQVDQEVLTLAARFDEARSKGVYRLICLYALVLNPGCKEVEIDEKALVFEKGVYVVGLVPDEEILPCHVGLFNLSEQVWDPIGSPCRWMTHVCTGLNHV